MPCSPGLFFSPRQSSGVWSSGVGLGTLLAFRPSNNRWWPIILAGILCFCGLEVVFRASCPGSPDGPLFILFGLAISFLAVHLINRQRIWPLIVAGALGLLALVFTAEEFFPSSDVGPMVFIFCLGLVFLFIHFRRRRIWWPVIPGGVLVRHGHGPPAG